MYVCDYNEIILSYLILTYLILSYPNAIVLINVNHDILQITVHMELILTCAPEKQSCIVNIICP